MLQTKLFALKEDYRTLTGHDAPTSAKKVGKKKKGGSKDAAAVTTKAAAADSKGADSKGADSKGADSKGADAAAPKGSHKPADKNDKKANAQPAAAAAAAAATTTEEAEAKLSGEVMSVKEGGRDGGK